MKKFNICLLFVLSTFVSAMAQEVQEHLFPAITFHVVGGTIEYTVPAWDALAANGERVQRTEATNPGGSGDEPGPGGPGSPGGGTNIGDEDTAVEYNGIIVASSCGIPSEANFLDHQPRGAYDVFDPVAWPSYSKIVINNQEYDPVTVTYGEILGEDFDADLGDYTLFTQGDITGNNYVIPSTAMPFDQDDKASIYNIVGLGDAAYFNWTYNTSGDKFEKAFFKAKSLTIPAHIKNLGRRSFQAAGLLTKVEFAEETEISEIPVGCFAHCQRLREIYIPSTVNEIKDHALGGCKTLGKIVFLSEGVPEIGTNAFTRFSESSATNVTKENCVIWVNSMETVRGYRAANSLWNAFSFCFPFELTKSVISYCSNEFVISQGPLVLGKDDAANTWTYDKNSALGQGKLKIYYVNKLSNWLKPGYDATTQQYTIQLLQMTGSPAKKQFGVLISGEPGILDMYVRATTTAGNNTENNLLVGVWEPEDMDSKINDPDNDIYLLKDGTFHICTGGILPANKAYLKLPKNIFDGIRTTDAKNINIEIGQEGDDIDGIEAIDNSPLTIDNVYDLSGQKVAENAQISTLPKGIYIMNGKKYILK